MTASSPSRPWRYLRPAAQRRAAVRRSAFGFVVLYAGQIRKRSKRCASSSPIAVPWGRPGDARRPSAFAPRGCMLRTSAPSRRADPWPFLRKRASGVEHWLAATRRLWPLRCGESDRAALYGQSDGSADGRGGYATDAPLPCSQARLANGRPMLISGLPMRAVTPDLLHLCNLRAPFRAIPQTTGPDACPCRHST